MGYTLAELREYARWRLDEHADNYLETADATRFDLDKALFRGYCEYARLTKAFPVEYTRSSIAGVHTYHYAGFGAQAADADAISVSARADNTTALTIAADPGQLSRITVAIANNGTGVNTGSAATYTVAGYGRGYRPITETVSFSLAELTDLAAGAVVTKTTDAYFLDITSITPSAAQPAQSLPGVDWRHYAGVPVETPGSRIFEVDHVEYDERILIAAQPHDLDRYMSTWRTASSGTPSHWIPGGAQSIRLWRTCSGTGSIGLFGWELPASTTFDDDTDEPDCDEVTAYATIPIWACILATCRNPGDANELRRNVFHKEWLAGVQDSCRRIHGASDGSIVFGKYAGTVRSAGLSRESTITNIT